MRSFLIGAALVAALFAVPVQASSTGFVIGADGGGQPIVMRDGLPFDGRGANYILTNKANEGVTFDAGVYSASEIERVFTAMQGYQYTAVRLFAWPSGLGGTSANSLNSISVTNLADALTRAKNHHLAVSLAMGGLPSSYTPSGTSTFRKPGVQKVGRSDATHLTGNNWTYLDQSAEDAHVRFSRDLLTALIAAHAPLDDVYGFEVTGEIAFTNDYPFNQTGPVTLKGVTYQFPAQAQAAMDDGLETYVNRISNAIKAVLPSALTVVQLQPPAVSQDASVTFPSGAALARMTNDYFALSLYPTFDIGLAAQISSLHLPAGKARTDIETGWLTYYSGDRAQLAIRSQQWERDQCAYNVRGALWFTWNTFTNYDTMTANDNLFAYDLSGQVMGQPCGAKPGAVPVARAGGVVQQTTAPPPAPMPVPRQSSGTQSSVTAIPNPLPIRR